MEMKYALITGSGRDLGRCLALRFAEGGYGIIINARSQSNLDRVSEEIRDLGVGVYSVLGDVTSQTTIDNLLGTAYDCNLEVLINNAGMPSLDKPFDTVTDEEMYKLLETNLIAPMKLTKGIYSVMRKKKKGTIINIGSIVGFEAKREKTTCCTSRFGIRGFNSTLRLEAEENNVCIIGVYPTKIKTSLDENIDFGLEQQDVANMIYEKFNEGYSGPLEIDGREEKYKPKERIEHG